MRCHFHQHQKYRTVLYYDTMDTITACLSQRRWHSQRRWLDGSERDLRLLLPTGYAGHLVAGRVRRLCVSITLCLQLLLLLLLLYRDNQYLRRGRTRRWQWFRQQRERLLLALHYYHHGE